MLLKSLAALLCELTTMVTDWQWARLLLFKSTIQQSKVWL